MRWPPRVPFPIILPALALAIWCVIVAVPAASNLRALHAVPRAATSANTTVTLDRFHAVLLPRELLPFAVNAAIYTHSHAITALNLPGALLEMPVEVALTNPDAWYARRLNAWSLRAVLTPLYGLPFWYLAGLGLDALFHHRRPRRVALLLSTALFGLFAAFAASLPVAQQPTGLWVILGFTLWTPLFALLPAAWLRYFFSNTRK
jgi:hypothetical protein